MYIGNSGKIYSYAGNDNGKILSPNQTYREGGNLNRYRVQGSKLYMKSNDGENVLDVVITVRNGTCGVLVKSSDPNYVIKSTRSNLRCKIADGNGFAR